MYRHKWVVAPHLCCWDDENLPPIFPSAAYFKATGYRHGFVSLFNEKIRIMMRRSVIFLLLSLAAVFMDTEMYWMKLVE
jgi:hypothetical protein